MPLMHSKSKKAVGKNIETEQEAGKPHNQAVAIAMDVQRRAKAKKMAMGGNVELEQSHLEPHESDALIGELMHKRQQKMQMMAEGGMIEDTDEQSPFELKPDDDEMFSGEAHREQNYEHEEGWHDEEDAKKKRSALLSRALAMSK